MLLTQADKIILSKFLTLKNFGYYSLASAVSSALYRLIGPVFSTYYPRLTQLVTLNKIEQLKPVYHQACQIIAVIVIPVMAVFIFFSKEIVWLWTQNLETAVNIYILVSILISGTALNGIMHIPYALQLAYGWTRFAFITTLISLFFFLPLIIILSNQYGAIGGASAWLILNIGYVFIAAPLMYRKLLTTEKWEWLIKDVGKPIIIALIVSGMLKLLFSNFLPNITSSVFLELLKIIIVVGASFFITAFFSPLFINIKEVLLWKKRLKNR
jgi:O-antigen/teichoic acid export membrane protein